MDSRTRTCFLYETWRPAFQHFSLSGFQDSKGRVSGCRVPNLPKRVLTLPHAFSQLVWGRFTHRLPGNSIYLRNHLRRGYTFGGALLLRRLH